MDLAWPATALAAGVLAATAACARIEPFVCADASQCGHAGLPGTCEPTGYCSFADPSCAASGRRYGEAAGEGLAGLCVEGAGPDAGVVRPDAATADGAADGGTPCAWGPFSAPVRLAGPLNAAGDDDWAPRTSFDGRALYLKSWRGGGLGQGDLWVATRPDKGSTFSAAVNLTGLNSAWDEGPGGLTGDGRLLVFSSDRPGGSGGTDLWAATRLDDTSPFSAPAPLVGVDSPADEGGGSPTADGLELYLSIDVGAGADVYVARRADGGAAFGAPTPVPGVSSPSADRVPSLSWDGLELYFASDRPGGEGLFDVWVARRPSRAAAFGSPQNVREVNSSRDEFGPSLSADGRTLYLAFDARLDGSADADVWTASRGCLP